MLRSLFIFVAAALLSAPALANVPAEAAGHLNATTTLIELWSNLVYGHQAIFLSDCSITCSPSWNLTLLPTRVSS